jgi:hypothetical protein
MILLPNCGCCGCPCGPETLPWTDANDVSMSFVFSGGQTVSVCQNEGSTLTLQNLSLCEYTSTYDVTVSDTLCQVTVFFLNNSRPCFTINGWTTNCPVGLTAITLGGPCS